MQGKRLVFKKKFNVELEEFTVGELQDHQILVKVSASLTSPGTELSIYTGINQGLKNPEDSWAKFPFYPGYAASGEVISCGKKVARLRKGDRIFFPAPHGNYSIIEGNSLSIIKLPQDVSFQQACFISLGSIAMTSVVVSHVKLGDSVAVIGLGLIGQLALQLFRINGAERIIGIDIIDKRLEVSRECGATDTINPKNVNLKEEIEKLTGKKGVNIVVEATGNPEAIKDALKIAGERAEIILLGSPRGMVKNLDLYTELHCKGLSITGAHACILPVNSSETWSRVKSMNLVLSYIRKGELLVDKLISHIVPPEDAGTAYQGLLKSKEQFYGVMFDWDR